MKNRCPLCEKGQLTRSGAHDYCSDCVYTGFNITEDYKHACNNVLATLCSNTKFGSQSDYEGLLERHMFMHMPRYYNWLESVTTGRMRMLSKIAEEVKQSAINLQIGHDINNPEEAANDLVCQCGSNAFKTYLLPSRLVCESCDALYVYNENEGIYMPEFLCRCGYAAYEVLEDRKSVV